MKKIPVISILFSLITLAMVYLKFNTDFRASIFIGAVTSIIALITALICIIRKRNGFSIFLVVVAAALFLICICYSAILTILA